ncbi:MAG: NlpC/P60 family protein [Micropruina sp.]|uniref:C40 family peptidase n=1 Tax=Micropruina sp. TaxID=2737536 RepID=UPI0039E4C312
MFGRRFALSTTLAVSTSLVLTIAPAALPAFAEETPPPATTETAPAPAATKPESVNPDPVAPSKADKLRAKANTVIKAAKSKVKNGQYKWGASGPNKFDCSGFMVWSFKKIGIKLPHSSRAQSTKGVKVAKKNLKPGDLVFFYSPVHHVGLYIGDGKIVHARNTRDDLEISSLKKYGHYHSARRVIR